MSVSEIARLRHELQSAALPATATRKGLFTASDFAKLIAIEALAEVNAAENVGATGIGVFEVKSGTTNQFLKIIGSSAIGVTGGGGGGTGITIKVVDDVQLPGLEGLNLPGGTTGQQPASPVEGDLRKNTTTNVIEYYNGSAWKDLTANTGLLNIIEDTSPQLGAHLDVNGFQITSVADLSLKLGDSAGASLLRILDSESATVASINSDGLILGQILTLAVADGTAPMNVASTTRVPNLNADLLDGSHAAAFAAASHNHAAGDITSGTLDEARVSTHTGDVTGATALTIGTDKVVTAKILDSNVTLAKLADLAQDLIIGRITASTGVPEALSAANVRTILSVESGSTADQTDSEIETAYNAQVAAVSQVTAEAGTDTAITRWTAERVKQAIAALESGLANIVEDTTPELGGELDALGNAIIDSTTNLKIGVVGDTEFGDGTERNVNPQTDLKINLGTASKRYNEAWINELHVQRSTASVSNPPTDAELDTEFGTPAAAGDGFVAILDDGSLEDNVYLIVATDNKWWHVALTEAV